MTNPNSCESFQTTKELHIEDLLEKALNELCELNSCSSVSKDVETKVLRYLQDNISSNQKGVLSIPSTLTSVSVRDARWEEPSYVWLIEKDCKITTSTFKINNRLQKVTAKKTPTTVANVVEIHFSEPNKLVTSFVNSLESNPGVTFYEETNVLTIVKSEYCLDSNSPGGVSLSVKLSPNSPQSVKCVFPRVNVNMIIIELN